MNDSLKYLTGAGITYLLIAACSGVDASDGIAPSQDASADGREQPGSDSGLLDRFAAALDSALGALDSAADAVTDPVPSATANESGSRIKAKWIVGDDGSRTFVGTYDSEREEECVWTYATDGSRRCLPIGGVASAYPQFTDSACTLRIFQRTTTCSNLGLNYIPVNGGCSETPYLYELHTLSAPLTAGTVTYGMSDDSCVEVSVIPDNIYTYHSSTGAIPPSSFARGTTQTDP